MQPLPPTITTSLFSSAAGHFAAAASKPGPAAAPLLAEAAHELHQGIPSLRVAAGRDGAPLVSSLDAAARAAIDLSKAIAAGPAPVGASQTMLGWARLASDAAAFTAPLPPSW